MMRQSCKAPASSAVTNDACAGLEMVEESAEKIASINSKDKTLDGTTFLRGSKKKTVLCTVAEVIFSLILHITLSASAEHSGGFRFRLESLSKWSSLIGQFTSKFGFVTLKLFGYTSVLIPIYSE